MKAAGLKSGTLYPLLGRLEDEKLVTSAWEIPQQDGPFHDTFHGQAIDRRWPTRQQAGLAFHVTPPRG